MLFVIIFGSADQPRSNHGTTTMTTTMTTTPTTATTRTHRRAQMAPCTKQSKMLRKTIYYVPVSTTKTARNIKSQTATTTTTAHTKEEYGGSLDEAIF
jgi:hypothetical protein